MGILEKIRQYSKNKSKETKAAYQNYMQVTAPSAFMTGADLALRYYDHYRRISFWFILAGGIMLIASGKLLAGGICLGILHLQIMFNQLWWKLVHIEHGQKP